MKSFFPFLVLVCSAPLVFADGPADNLVDNVRRIPPPGVKIAAGDRQELESGAADLGREIDSLRAALTNKPALLALMPDVQVYHKAVDWALRYDEFFRSNEVAAARQLLKQGTARATELREGRPSWLSATGLVVRGYLSRIDGSVQPYGMVVPVSFQPGGEPKRLDFWFHGRGEQLSELSFINDRQRSYGEFVPRNAFVLHTYGRYCNGQRFAGETDVFEALEHARKYYPIDENRLVVRGFSLGGAACWHIATHHAGLWAAAAPGAGFSETADFLKVFQNESLQPTSYEQQLWHMYDSTDYALNLFNCPTVAYSGEIDRQKQAADKMEAALADSGIRMVHIIGPKTAHQYHREAREEINRRIDSITAAGRNPVPRQVRLTTWTLRYNKMFWIEISGLKKHWERATVFAEILPNQSLAITTTNVTRLTLSMAPGQCPLDPMKIPAVRLDGKSVAAPKPVSDRSWHVEFVKNDGWEIAPAMDPTALAKRPGLQGPIDDAFMEPFLMVRPTGQSRNEKVEKWVNAEMAHAIEHWRRQFRGDAQVRNDVDVTDDEIANRNLILWGDAASNRLLARIADRLPVGWKESQVLLGDRSFAADHHIPVLIFPNPLNSRRYVVLNSGFTFREYDYLNNARQTSKLPDYAIIDLDQPANSRFPGKIAAAGFFDEAWKLPAGN